MPAGYAPRFSNRLLTDDIQVRGECRSRHELYLQVVPAMNVGGEDADPGVV